MRVQLAWAEVAKILWAAMTGAMPSPNSEIEWTSAMHALNRGASKLHHEIPFAGESVDHFEPSGALTASTAAGAAQIISELTNCTSPVA